MRRCLAAVILMLLTIWPPAPEKAAASIEPSYSAVTYHYANCLTSYFKTKGCLSSVPCGNEAWILSFTAQQMYWLRFFNIEHTAEKFLSNTAAESWYNPRAISKAGCIGATQVCSIDLADNLLKSRGVNMERLSFDQKDAARGVAVYWHKLQRANGEPWEAVLRYNGAGKQARAHKNKVWRLHRDIFGGA